MATLPAAERSPSLRRLARFRRRVDDWRIREHLRRTEWALRRADVDGLTADQRAGRERNLDRLREYRARGQFPRNRHHERRTPVFVDDSGTHCAVGHLLREDERSDLVRPVRERNNTLRVEDLPADDPVVAWGAANGFTRAELARIQPAYPEAVQFATDCGPVPCWLAGVLASVVGLAAAGAVEWVGYRLCGEWFPDNALKRRGALAYLSVLALLLAPLVALLTYALFP
ncbi:hypothetical protein N0B31_02155 [Salinirubellus salinus]|uniref:Uncharacterized protein n=1 Tax=Salinirubellus salinus TaxID=1364945 RepID=A0A9E7R471_9EURY|nr:hypothetical protein [Salinirubellus salinus]UWM55093.1 hypothetical protein N0B31_02155 [Salinirubellus salinus]